MTAKTIHVVSAGTKAWAHTDNRLSALSFLSTCPNCKAARAQRAYGFRTLVTLLVDKQPIEAHCTVCNESWPINASERAALAWLLLTD